MSSLDEDMQFELVADGDEADAAEVDEADGGEAEENGDDD